MVQADDSQEPETDRELNPRNLDSLAPRPILQNRRPKALVEIDGSPPTVRWSPAELAPATLPVNPG